MFGISFLYMVESMLLSIQVCGTEICLLISSGKTRSEFFLFNFFFCMDSSVSTELFLA